MAACRHTGARGMVWPYQVQQHARLLVIVEGIANSTWIGFPSSVGEQGGTAPSLVDSFLSKQSSCG